MKRDHARAHGERVQAFPRWNRDRPSQPAASSLAAPRTRMRVVRIFSVLRRSVA